MPIRDIFIIATALLLLCSLNISAAEATYPLQPVTDGVYYHQGIHEDATAENLGAIANVGFIIGKDCVAVIDSGGSFKEGQLLTEAIKSVTDKPVCYVINTHVHPDHTLGNAAFKSADTIYIGHEKLPAAMAAREEFFQRNFSNVLGEAFNGVEFIPPTQTVSVGQPITIDLGERELLLTAYTTSHTDHDLTVLDKQTQTLWTGDLLFIERTPALDGSINGWITTSQQLQEMDVNYVVPGHGPAGSSDMLWQQGWQAQLDYLTSIRKQIREIILDFGTIDDATKRVGLEQEGKWQLFDEYHRRNVTAAFVELEWE